MCASIQGLHYASQGQQAQDLNISLTVTKTETEQRRRKPQGRVEDRYYTIQEYKALSNEQNKSQSYSQTMDQCWNWSEGNPIWHSSMCKCLNQL